MKKLFTITFVSLFCATLLFQASGQVAAPPVLPHNLPSTPGFVSVINSTEPFDTPPQFPDGNQALHSFLTENIRIPRGEFGDEYSRRGRLTARFHVMTTGEINHVEIESSLCSLLNAEVVRVLGTMPHWIPARSGEKYVESVAEISINFYLVRKTRFPERTTYQFVDEQQRGDFLIPYTQMRPEFPGGLPALMEFLGNNIQYPARAHRIRMQARLMVRFSVARDGSIENIEVVGFTQLGDGGISSISIGDIPLARQALEAEAVRVVRAMPNWYPGEINGVVTRGRFTLPITFRIG